MVQIAKDGIWVFKVVKSCTEKKHLAVAKKCYEQFQIKWLNKISLEDEVSVRVLNTYIELITSQFKNLECKITK
jgi:hypothetical protein